MTTNFPRQPIVKTETGVVRFQQNKVVDYLLDQASAGKRCSLNELFRKVGNGELPLQDYMQLMQLIGYSVSGYGDLAYGDGDERGEWQTDADECDKIAEEVFKRA